MKKVVIFLFVASTAIAATACGGSMNNNKKMYGKCIKTNNHKVDRPY